MRSGQPRRPELLPAPRHRQDLWAPRATRWWEWPRWPACANRQRCHPAFGQPNGWRTFRIAAADRQRAGAGALRGHRRPQLRRHGVRPTGDFFQVRQRVQFRVPADRRELPCRQSGHLCGGRGRHAADDRQGCVWGCEPLVPDCRRQRVVEQRGLAGRAGAEDSGACGECEQRQHLQALRPVEDHGEYESDADGAARGIRVRP